MKKLVDEVEHYFELFSRKDLEGVSRKFSDDIFVQDWDIYAQGKEKVSGGVANCCPWFTRREPSHRSSLQPLQSRMT